MSDSSTSIPSNSNPSGDQRVPPPTRGAELPRPRIQDSAGEETLTGESDWNREITQNVEGAYLVLHSAGRWSDIFRLTSPCEVIIGRSSRNDIAIRSEKASRQHARIWSSQSGWRIEDLGSRNGTRVAGRVIEGPHRLRDGDEIEIAGYSIQYVKHLQSASGPVAPPRPPGATEDQLTMAMDAAAITERRSQSGYFNVDEMLAGGNDDAIGRTKLLQLAFDLAGVDSTSQAIELVLDRMSAAVKFQSAGAYLVKLRSLSKGEQPTPEPGDVVLAATRQATAQTRANEEPSKDKRGPQPSYRRPADTAIESVISAGGHAILARNVGGDHQLATENSHGEIDAVSMILAPVRDRDGRVLGMLHLLSTESDSSFNSKDLEFVLAVAEILAESLRNLAVRGKLDRSLRKSQKQIQALKAQLGDKVEIVGKSDAVRSIIEKVTLAAPTGATVLVRGESGVGKELVASAIHHASPRAAGPLVCLNCAALSPSLLESELFGHERGAFTGATDRKRGKFEAADGGTLMLDEIGEMDAEIQAKFLRVLEGHSFERVGGQQPIKVDVRVVAATNRDLQAMVADGKFRQDLFYRLHVVEIVVPPLRNRGADILILATHFLSQFNEQMGKRVKGLTPNAEKMLLDYSWPGNIRELRNVIERAVVLNSTDRIDADHLLLTPALMAGTPQSTEGTSEPVEISLAELEQRHIERVLRHTDGNKSRAAAILGIERSTLDRKLKKFAKAN
ncbi:MAG: sigma 54-interacting transcriptional regulator [Planctomycetota bacterium]